MSRRTVISLAFALTTLSGTSALAQEPGLEGRDDILLQTSFESDDWYTQWGRDEAPRNTSLVRDDTSFRGDAFLRVDVPSGEHYGTSFAFKFADQGLEEPDEIYFRYVIRLGPDWTTEGGGGGKFPGFGGTYGTAGWGGRTSDGTNGWSSRMLFWQPDEGRADGDTRIGYYVYHADMPGTYGDNWFWSGGPIGENGALEVGRWYQIEAYVRINTPGENDGILRGWVDGTQVFERTDVRFRDTEDLKIEQVWFDLYYGGNWTAPRDMHVDFDNAVIARNPIGPVDDSPDPDPDADTGPSDNADAGESEDDAGTDTPDPDDGTDAGNEPTSDAGTGNGGGGSDNETAESGCCATIGSSSRTPLALFILIAAGALSRRRKRPAVHGS